MPAVIRETRVPNWLPFGLILFAIILNFTFDWRRGFDFTRESSELQSASVKLHDHAKKLQDEFDSYQSQMIVLVSDFQDRTSEEAKLLGSIHGLIKSLEEQLALIKESVALHSDLAAQTSNSDEPVTEPVGTKKLFDLKDAFNVPLSEILEREEFARHDNSFETRYASNLTDPGKWKGGNEMIEEFEAQYGVQLSREDRQLFSLKIDTYKALCSAAWSRYESGLNQSVAQRITGEGASEYAIEKAQAALTPELRKKAFAVINRGTVLVPFYKDKDAELYRQALIGVYVPRLMMDEVKAFFEERKSR